MIRKCNVILSAAYASPTCKAVSVVARKMLCGSRRQGAPGEELDDDNTHEYDDDL